MPLALALALVACRGGSKAKPDEDPPPAVPAAAEPARSAVTLEFADPPPGPRAPTTAAFGATIGKSTLAEVEAMVSGLGLRCGDTSIRAKMKAARAKREAEARARGEDAVTSASAKKRSEREQLPQVRYSCPNILAAQIGDRERVRAKGRLLFVFDSADHPLRHASFQRSHRIPKVALDDALDVLREFTRLYGPPTSQRGALPEPAADGTIAFAPVEAIIFTWAYADLLAQLNVTTLGKGGITVGERVEVPIGVRPDAPFSGE